MAPSAPSSQVALPPSAAGTYRLDPTRSAVTFTAKHMFGLGTVHGTWAVRSGEIVVGDPLSSSRVTAIVDAASFTSDKPRRDKHVKSGALMDASTYPDVSFTSTSAVESDGRWTLRGDLTAHGTTQPVDLAVEQVEMQESDVRVVARTHIDRYAFGVTKVKGMAGQHLDLELTVTGVPA